MDCRVILVLAIIATSLISVYVNCQSTIRYCDSYRDIYEAFSSCAIFSMYNTSDRNTVLFDKEVIDRQDLINLLNYWCSVLDATASCTSGKALRCRNRGAIALLASNTGGVCKSGKLNEEYELSISESFRYDTSCMSQALDITEKCEDQIPNIEYDVTIENGVDGMKSTVEQLLECNAKSLRASSNTCVSSQDSIWLFTLRALTFSVPHALGVDLPVSLVREIVRL